MGLLINWIYHLLVVMQEIKKVCGILGGQGFSSNVVYRMEYLSKVKFIESIILKMGYSSNRTFLVFRAFRVTYKNYYQFQSRRQPVPNWIPHRVGTVSYFDKSTLRYKAFRYKNFRYKSFDIKACSHSNKISLVQGHIIQYRQYINDVSLTSRVL